MTNQIESLPARRQSLHLTIRRWCINAKLAPAPTIFHITHWKAGSQWVRYILQSAMRNRIVEPDNDSRQFLSTPIRPGMVYPCVYVSKQMYESVRVPRNSRRFVVIRDLRDTLISGYFSFRNSHPLSSDIVHDFRDVLQREPFEQGMIFLMDKWLPHCAEIQQSWLEAREPMTRYEDLIDNDHAVFEHKLLGRCAMPCSPADRAVIEQRRFENLSGRKRGVEDASNHWRKGIAGDWKNHFNDTITSEFKSRFGEILIATGYEGDDGW